MKRSSFSITSKKDASHTFFCRSRVTSINSIDVKKMKNILEQLNNNLTRMTPETDVSSPIGSIIPSLQYRIDRIDTQLEKVS